MQHQSEEEKEREIFEQRIADNKAILLARCNAIGPASTISDYKRSCAPSKRPRSAQRKQGCGTRTKAELGLRTRPAVCYTDLKLQHQPHDSLGKRRAMPGASVPPHNTRAEQVDAWLDMFDRSELPLERSQAGLRLLADQLVDIKCYASYARHGNLLQGDLDKLDGKCEGPERRALWAIVRSEGGVCLNMVLTDG